MNNEEKYQLKWSYDDTSTVKYFVVEKCTTIKSVVAKFIISKKKKKIRYVIIYCNLPDCLAESIELVEDFIDECGDIISEDNKCIEMPI